MDIDLTKDLKEFDQVERTDWPDQRQEGRVRLGTDLGIKAAWKISDVLSETMEEERLILWQIAMGLLEQLGSRFSSDVLAQRLARRADAG